MAYDASRGAVVLFGGFGNNDALWEFAAACAAPRVTAQPISRAINAGGPATFTVAADGGGALAYQWRRDGLDLVNGGNISGATGPTLTIDPASAADAGWYACVVSSGCGSVASSAALLSGCYPNCDGGTTSPALNVNDLVCFINSFAAGDPYANCDQSTTPPILNVNDFACFLSAFRAGCP